MKLLQTSLALTTGNAGAALKAPLPEFKNEKQLAEWRAEKASQPNTRSATAEPAFYTGKPYLAYSGSYVFKYRSYNPEMARWTSEDPSGFPDGTNNLLYVRNLSLNSFDPTGLAKMSCDQGTLTWYNGQPRPLSVSQQFDDYFQDVGLKPNDFPDFLSQFNSASEGEAITSFYGHNFGDTYAVGRATFELNGSVSVGAYGDKYFNGVITIQDDIFNFDTQPWGSRTVPNEILTRLLNNTAFNPALGGKEFTMTFSGSKEVDYVE